MPVLCEKRRLRARPQLKQNGVNRPFSGLAVLWSPADERVNAKQRRERRRRGRDGGPDRRDRGGRHRCRRVCAADRRVQPKRGQQLRIAVGRHRLGPPGTSQLVGATEYGGPGDPSSGVVGASGANLLSHPDSYAELGGDTFQTATCDRRAAVSDAAAHHVGPPVHDRLQARLRARRRSGRRASEGDRPVVAARGPPGDPVRQRALVRPGADRAPHASRRCGNRR